MVSKSAVMNRQLKQAGSRRDSLNDLSPAALKAAMTTGVSGWGRWGSAERHALYVEPAIPAMRRRKCHCGCGGRISHMTAANGVGLFWGCELSAHRFAKEAGRCR